MGLCLGFVLKAVLINRDAFVIAERCLQNQSLFCFSYSPTTEKAGSAQETGKRYTQES